MVWPKCLYEWHKLNKHLLDLLGGSYHKPRVFIWIRKLHSHAAVLLRDFLGVKRNVIVAEDVFELDLQSVCDFLANIHLELILIVFYFFTQVLLILTQLTFHFLDLLFYSSVVTITSLFDIISFPFQLI